MIRRRDFLALATGATQLAGRHGPLFSWPEPAAGASTGLFNVLDYGARGDGGADDTVAIQAAINAAQAAAGGTVYLPRGTYLTSGVTVNADNVAIRGVGSTSVLKAGLGAPFIVRLTTTAARAAPLYNRFESFRMDPNGVPGIKCLLQDGGWYVHASQLSLVEAHLPDAGAYGLYVRTTATNGGSFVSTYDDCCLKRVGFFGANRLAQVTTITLTNLDAVWVEAYYAFCLVFVGGALQDKVGAGDSRVTLTHAGAVTFLGTDFEAGGHAVTFGAGCRHVYGIGCNFVNFKGTLLDGAIPASCNLPYGIGEAALGGGIPRMLAGSATFQNSATVAVGFAQALPDAAYKVVVTGSGNMVLWVTGKRATGFTINAASPSGDTVDWVLLA